MGKKYLETKKGSLESSILGVWQNAIEEGDARVSAARMDGRTTEYKSHRAKLETARQRREEKKINKESLRKIKSRKHGGGNTPADQGRAAAVEDDIERAEKKGDKKEVARLKEGKMKELHMYIQQGKSAEWIAKTMGVDVKTIKALMSESLNEGYFEDTLYEWALDLDDKAFDDILESMSDEEILAFDEGIGDFIQKRTGLGFGGKKKRAGHLQKKAKKAKEKSQAIKDIDTAKADIRKAKQDRKDYKAKKKQDKKDAKAAKKGDTDDYVPGGPKEPVAKEPTEKEPVAKEPTEKEPVAKEPTEKEPVAKEPTGKEPTDDEKQAKAAAQQKYNDALANWNKDKPEKKDDEESDAFANRMKAWNEKKPKSPSESFDPLMAAVEEALMKVRTGKPADLSEASGDKEAYQKFFNKTLKKFKIDSPADLKSDEEKKKFYDYIDKNWEGDHEESFDHVKEFKVQSMRDALAQIWNVEEGKNPFKKEDDEKEVTKDGKTLTGKKAAKIDINPEIKD